MSSWSWKDIGGAVGKFAPVLGTVLGGPAGGAIGSLVAAALGVENNPSEVMKAIETNPDIAVKLKALELEHQANLNKHIEVMAQIDLEYARNDVENTASARRREEALAEQGKINLIQPILAIIGVLAFFGLAIYVVKFGLPNMTKEESFIIGTVIGSVMMIGKDIYGYYFGSSSGSKQKTLHLAKGK